MGKDQREIKRAIDLGELVVQCCGTGLVKVPSSGDYVGYRFEKPYELISHGLCTEAYLDAVDLCKLRRYGAVDK